MEKINITTVKSTPDENGTFQVNLHAWHRGEQFVQPVGLYTAETWTHQEYLVHASEFDRNIRSQFE